MKPRLKNISWNWQNISMGLFFKTEYKGNYNTLHFHFKQLEVKKGQKKRSNEQINNIILINSSETQS